MTAGLESKLPNPTGVSRYRLLVIDDTPVNQEVLIGMLKYLGYSADVAADARSALDMLRHTSYALLLLDCQLPEMNGYDLCRLIRTPSNGVVNHQVSIVGVTPILRPEPAKSV